MKTMIISDNSMDIPQTEKEWEQYYKLVKKYKKLCEKGIIVDYA